MSIQGLINIRKALSTLNPKQVREMSDRPLHVALHAGSQEAYQRMESFFLRDLSPARRRESAMLLTRAPIPALGQRYDFSVYDEGLASPPGALVFHADRTHHFVEKTLASHAGSWGSPRQSVPSIPPPVCRASDCEDLLARTRCFSIATALPDILPSIIELPWAVAEFASDTAFLTMNQVRMAFLIAAASDREVGYLEQKSEIAMVIGSAFGWRALARQLVGKIPFGGGLIGKAAVAYAGTKVLGISLDHFYSIGFTYTREERDRLYADAFRQGKKVATRMLTYLRPDLAAKFAANAKKETIGVRSASQFQT